MRGYFFMNNMMWTLSKTRPEKGLELIQKPIPTFEDDEVLLKVLATSICGTDKHIYDWDEWSQHRLRPPLTVGHEMVGEVQAVGTKVKTIQVGDIVSVETHIVCNACELCRTGNSHICEHTEIIGVDRDGAFAQYISMPASNCIVNRQANIDIRNLAVLEPLGNAIHTISQFDITGKHVAVVGCGPIGLMAINAAKALGAAKVIALEIDEYRIQLAHKMGAHVVINPKTEHAIERIFEETIEGIDVLLEFSGNKGAIEESFKYMKMGGKMSMLGIPSKSIQINLADDFIFKGIQMHGVIGRMMYDTWYKVNGLIQADVIHFEGIITHEFDMEDFQQAFDLLDTGQCGKIVLYPNGRP
jgi:threonine 3-dehydrogenase